MSSKIQRPRAKFGELAIKAGVITLEQLHAALQKQLADVPRQAIGEVLIEMGFCVQADIEMILEVQSKLRNGGFDAEGVIRQACEATGEKDIAELRALVLGPKVGNGSEGE